MLELSAAYTDVLGILHDGRDTHQTYNQIVMKELVFLGKNEQKGRHTFDGRRVGQGTLRKQCLGSDLKTGKATGIGKNAAKETASFWELERTF